MKKLLFGAAALLMMASCTGKEGAEKANEGSALVESTQNDTLTPTENVIDTTSSEQIETESSSQDKTAQIDVDNLYKKGLVITKGKKSEKRVGDHTDLDITLPVTITNNTGIDLNPKDYVISYKVDEMYADGTGLASRIRTATHRGPKIANGETVKVKLFESNVLDIVKPKIKLKLNKEEFTKRLSETN